MSKFKTIVIGVGSMLKTVKTLFENTDEKIIVVNKEMKDETIIDREEQLKLSLHEQLEKEKYYKIDAVPYEMSFNERRPIFTENKNYIDGTRKYKRKYK